MAAVDGAADRSNLIRVIPAKEGSASALTEDDCPLTDRELDVLQAARTGISVDEIPQQVHLAPGTVRNYLSNAMSKLHVDSRHPPPTAPAKKAGSDRLHRASTP